MLLDSNVIIDAAKPGGEHLAAWVNDANASVSIITRIESLGFPRLSAQEEKAITDSLGWLTELPLDDDVVQRAVALRQRKAMKLGDAIIAATALEYEVPLITRNVGDFKHIEGLDLRNPFDKSA